MLADTEIITPTTAFGLLSFITISLLGLLGFILKVVMPKDRQDFRESLEKVTERSFHAVEKIKDDTMRSMQTIHDACHREQARTLADVKEMHERSDRTSANLANSINELTKHVRQSGAVKTGA